MWVTDRKCGKNELIALLKRSSTQVSLQWLIESEHNFCACKKLDLFILYEAREKLSQSFLAA
jgi:hypothetical protein